jgi:uncharacterized protein
VDLLEIIAIGAAGMAAGAMNAVVGSGTLVTFPVLLAFGYPPVTANVSNTVGLVAGGATGAVGYRRELKGQRSRTLRFAIASVAGGITGAVLLLELPSSAFDAIVPVFIAIALVLIVLQPRLNRALADRVRSDKPHGTGIWRIPVFFTGIYGGYFGAAQGIMLMAILGLALPDDLQKANGLKNVLTTLVNLVAALIFIAVADVRWGVAAAITVGSMIGAWIGARYGRRAPDWLLRTFCVIVGLAAIIQLVLR